MKTDMVYDDKKRFVVDTVAITSYFAEIFDQKQQISSKGLEWIKNAFAHPYSYIMIVPSIVFVEIFDNWFKPYHGLDEFRAKFTAEVIHPILQAPNIEIREIDTEIMETFLRLGDSSNRLENRDRIILASAVTLQTPLVTSDPKIIQYCNIHSGIIPRIIN